MKRSITVERNVVFNENDVQAGDESINISGGILSEGEMESRKIIQSAHIRAEDPEKSTENDKQPEKVVSDNEEDSNQSNKIPFPTVSEPVTEDKNKNGESEDLENYGRGRRP